MQIRLFSKYVLVAIFGFASYSLAAQNIEVENTCAMEETTFILDSTINVLNTILWTVDGQTSQPTDSMTITETIREVKTIEVIALWEEEVLDSLNTVADTITVTDTLMVSIEECPCDVGMPNVFTPVDEDINLNTPSNINKSFGGIARTPCDSERYALFQLQIYSRWGQLIYDSCDGQSMPCKENRKWDGKSNTGKPLPPDTYIYVLQYQIEDIPGGITHEVVREQGEVLLLR